MIENPYKTLIIIAGGNSIPQNLNYRNFNGIFTFGLNYVCRVYEPTVLIWLDRYFYWNNKEYIKGKSATTITKLKNIGWEPPNIIKLKAGSDYYGSEGLEKGLFKGELGGLTGLFALSLSIALGFEEIYLLGYDMAKVEDRTHFHNSSKESEEHHLRTYRENLKYFEVYKNCEAKVYNVSPESAIEVFPKIDYLEFITRMKNTKPIDQKKAREWLRQALKK